MSGDLLTFLTATAAKYAARPVATDEAIYQDAGINGADFLEFLEEIGTGYVVPSFDAERFADTSEPRRGLSLFGKIRILDRERLTCAHLATIIAAGHWIDP